MSHALPTSRGMGQILTVARWVVWPERPVFKLRDTRDVPLHPDQMEYVRSLCGMSMGRGQALGHPPHPQYPINYGKFMKR